MATQDEIDALSRSKDSELQSASVLDDKIQQLNSDSQAQIGKFQQKAQIYRTSGVEGDLDKASEMDHQVEQNRTYMSQEIDGLRSQAAEHRANAEKIQAKIDQKQTELQKEREKQVREEQEKNEKMKDVAEEAAKHILF